jgi:hypothetical protein
MPLRRLPHTNLRLVALVLVSLAFGLMLFKHLSHPLIWNDEAETVMYGTRILEYGYPKVHGRRNVVLELNAPVHVGLKEGIDAYIGATWGQFYFATLGVLLAKLSDDPFAKTALLRLPFAVAGCLGLVVLCAALAPAFARERDRGLSFAVLFLTLMAVSISLILHLREARHIPLVVLVCACLVHVHLGYTVFGTVGFVRWCASTSVLLVLLFNTFYPASVAAGAPLALHVAFCAWREGGGVSNRIRRMLRASIPFVAAAAVIAPLLVFFETLRVARFMSRVWGLSPDGYVTNVVHMVQYFARHEMLVPVLVVKVALVVQWWRTRGTTRWLERLPMVEASNFLALFFVLYLLVVTWSPHEFVRYVVVLSPFLTASFVLDVALVAGLSRDPASTSPRTMLRGIAVLAAVALVAWLGWTRNEEIRGRLREISEPYQGPLDFVIPHLMERYEDPAQLVIATNYEGPSIMYYLGSHVIVGRLGNNLRADRELEPDVVIPRRRWIWQRELLAEMVRRGDFERKTFPVVDYYVNNLPDLTRSSPHLFETPVPTEEGEALEIFLRR